MLGFADTAMKMIFIDQKQRIREDRKGALGMPIAGEDRGNLDASEKESAS
jgi:hypothetical protein